MKIKRQLVLKNKITNKLRKINWVTFHYDCGDYCGGTMSKWELAE